MANGLINYTREEFATKLREKYPDKWNHYGDDQLIKKVVKDHPQYKKLITDFDKPSYAEYDPDIGDHLSKAWFNFKSMGVEIPQAVIGITASLLDKDSDVRDVMLNYSEGLRDWSQKKQDEWIESDPGIQGYLEWQQDKPLSLENFWHFDMMLRGVSDLAPSIATMMIGTGGASLALKAMGAGAKLLKYGSQAGAMVSMGALEGSGEYAEAMRYLVDEKGMNPNDAVDTAANASIAVGVGNGLLEFYGVNRLMKVVGLSASGAKRTLTRKMIDKLTSNKYLNKTGDVLSNAVIEGMTEATQAINQELVENIYKKYGGDIDEAFNYFAKDFKAAAVSPETKESYYSALAGTLLMGGTGAGVSGTSKRLLKGYKDRQTDEDIVDDISGETRPSGDTPRSPSGVNLAHIIHGSAELTKEEEDILYDEKRKHDGIQKRTAAAIDHVINNGAEALDEAGIDPDAFISKLENSVEEYGIDPRQLEEAQNVVNEIKEVRRIEQELIDEGLETGTEADQIIEDPIIEEEPISEAVSEIETLPIKQAETKLKSVETELAKGKLTPERKSALKEQQVALQERLKVTTPVKTKKQKEYQSVQKEILSINQKISKEKEALGKLSEEKRYEIDPLTLERTGDSDAARIHFEEIRGLEGIKEKLQVKLDKLVPKEKKGVIPSKYQAEKDVDEKKVVKPIRPKGKEGDQETFKFQQIKKTEGTKIKENKQVAKKIASKLKKKFPFIKAKAIEKVFNEEGQEVAGRALGNIVEWSTTEGTLDTIPHEYAHIYVKIMGDHPLIKEGKKRFGGEENLVQHIGDYYAGKIQDKGLLSRLKTWLRKWTNALKNFFGMAMTDKEVADLVSEKFYSYKMKESDLQALDKTGVEYQEIRSAIKFETDPSPGYKARTRRNASADATIAIAVDFTSAGEKLTKSQVLSQKKKYIAINAKSIKITPERVNKIVDMLNSVNAKTLNIAGNGIYTMKGMYTQAEVDTFTYDLLKAVVNHPKLKNKIESVRTGGQTGFDEAGAKAGSRLGIPTRILAPKGWKYRPEHGKDISDETLFKARFKVKEEKKAPVDIKEQPIKVELAEEGVMNTEEETNIATDGITDNDISLNEKEIDARESIQRAIDRSLRILGIPIDAIERNELYDGIKQKYRDFDETGFDEWINTDLANVIDISILKKKGKLDAAKLLYTFISNKVPINQDRGEGNAVNYLRLIKSRLTKKEYAYILDLVVPGMKVFSRKDGRGFIKKQKQSDVGFIAHAHEHLSELLKSIYVITDGMFFLGNREKAKLSYSFLNTNDLRSLDGKTIRYTFKVPKEKVNKETGEIEKVEEKKGRSVKETDTVTLFSRGDKGKVAMGIVKSIHREIAQDNTKWEKFWNDMKDMGYITDSQLKNYLMITTHGTGLKKDIKLRSRAIAVFDYLNSFVPGWLVKTDFPNLLKRIKVPLTPSFTNKKVPDAKVRFIDRKNIRFQYKDEKKRDGIEKIEGLPDTYIGDGNTLTSRSYIRAAAKAYGLNPDVGWLKSVIYDVENYRNDDGSYKPLEDIKDKDGNITEKGINLLIMKHQHSIPEAGLKIYDGNTLVAEVDINGDMKDPEGNIIEMITTDDEVKMRNGEYGKNEFTVPGKAFGLVKMSTGKKYGVKFPLQWMNHITDLELIEDLVEVFTGSNSKSQQILKTLMQATRDPDKIKILAKGLKSRYEEEINTGLHNDIMVSGGLHSRDAGRLEITTRGKVIDPAVNLDGQSGTMLYFAPNYRRDLKINEISVDIDTILKNPKLNKKFRTAYPNVRPGTESIFINKWLEKNDIRVLAYRSPVAYIGGVNYLRIRRLNDGGLKGVDGTVQIHPDTVFLGYEGDSDGDTLFILDMPDALDTKLKDYFNSKEFTNKVKGVDLKKLEGKKHKLNAVHPQDRAETISAMIYSNTAIREIASTQLIFGLIKNSLVSATVKGQKIIPNTDIIDMGNGVKGTADHILRVYLQAAVDNPKYLYLKEWKYNVSQLRKSLFKLETGETILDIEPGYKKDGLWQEFNDGIWKKYKEAADIKNMDDPKSGNKVSVESLIDMSQQYIKFINGRLGTTLTSGEFDVKATFNTNIGLLERSVSLLHEMFERYENQGPEGVDSRRSPLRYDEVSYNAAHLLAKDKLNIESKLEELRSKMGETKFKAAQKLARNVLEKTKSIMTNENGNRRPMQPNSWDANSDLVDLRVGPLLKLSESSKEGRDVVTLTMLNEIKDLDLLVPSQYLTSLQNQYFKVHNQYLKGEPTTDEVADVSMDEAKRKGCDL